jgi:hypothetical protein
MLGDFARILARVQSDFGFYIRCQTNPDLALEGYSLSPGERETLLDPVKLSAALGETARENGPTGLIITFSGKHDWVNRTKTKTGLAGESTAAARDAQVSREIEAIRQADSDEDRATAAVRLLTLIE